MGSGTAPFSNSNSNGVQIVADFDGSDGASPTGLMLFKNHLYGTTEQGGANGYGVLYKVSASGDIEPLYSFDGDEGSKPVSRPVAVGSVLFGTTSLGGYEGYGTVYKYVDGQFTKLFEFPGSPNGGAYPNGLTLLDGLLYGTTFGGGSHALGTIFVLTASGPKTIYNFSDGEEPTTTALTACVGALYGTTSSGGAYQHGAVYKVTTSGQESVIYSFRGKDGEEPLAGLVNVNGKLFGTTYSGGQSGYGVIFEVSRSGKERVLHNFGYRDAGGGEPRAGLVYLNGRLYGTTSSGGEYGNGAIFSLNLSGTGFEVLSTFGGLFGNAESSSTLVAFNGALYGTTMQGGGHYDGMLFRLDL
jgi:uncharacterized repeat protein (TIGR03803 family)